MGHTCNNHFTSSGGGEQNIAQGDHAIGKQENATQEVRGDGNIFSGTGNVTVNHYGVPYEAYGELAGKYAVTESALASFFRILEEQQVPLSDLDSKLREIATQYKELLRNWEAVQSTDPQAAKLKAEAKQAIDAGDYAKAEELLEDIARHHSFAAAEAHADNARLQRVQLRYAKAAAYWQKAAALLPEDEKKERSLYLVNAGYDLKYIGKDTEALSLYERSLAICQEIREQAWEGRALNNISQIYHERGGLCYRPEVSGAKPCHQAGDWRQGRRRYDAEQHRRDSLGTGRLRCCPEVSGAEPGHQAGDRRQGRRRRDAEQHWHDIQDTVIRVKLREGLDRTFFLI